MAPTFDLSLYHSLTNPTPYPHTCSSWEAVVECLGTHTPHFDKKLVTMFGAHTLLPGHDVSNEAVTSVTFGVLDLDKGWTEARILKVLASIEGAFVFATSWSHGGPDNLKGRLMFPFSRPVLPSEWPRLWHVLNDRYAEGAADPACKDLARRYFRPSYPEGAAHPPEYIRQDGEPLDVDALLLEAPAGSHPASQDASSGTNPNQGSLKALAERIRASKAPGAQSLSTAIRSVARGEPFASAGERDTTLFKVCSKMVAYWPTLDIGKAAALFAPSLALMGDDAPTMAKAEEMLTRLQRNATNLRAGRISDAFGSDRTTPYTTEELQAFAEASKVDPLTFRRHWVIQRGRTFYVFVNGAYKAYTEIDVSTAAVTQLAPAISAQIDPEKITPKGVTPKTPSELVLSYGTVASAVEIDMNAQTTHYDRARDVFVEAPCPIRVTAEFNSDVAMWLELLAGPKHHTRLLQWISALTRLDRPCAALYLHGPGGVGKTLIAHGLARVFTAGRPTMLEEIFSDFNDGAMRCPLIFGDEIGPENTRHGELSSKLREVIQSHERVLKRKFMANATLKGSPRVLLAGNNTRLLDIREDLTPEDIQAIVERFFYLDVPKDEAGNAPARAFLESLPAGTIQAWVQNDVIAKHALFLGETVEVPDTGRFLVSGQASELTRTIATSAGTRAAVCNWLVNFLLKPALITRNASVAHLIRVEDSKLLVNAKVIAENWDSYVLHDKNAPSPTDVSKALAGLSPNRVSKREGDKVVWYRSVDLDNLVAWAESTGYADADTIARCVLALEASA